VSLALPETKIKSKKETCLYYTKAELRMMRDDISQDALGARTASAIDYIFSTKDVAQLICAVKTLDLSTRLSQDFAPTEV
jgi:hypothetical protein